MADSKTRVMATVKSIVNGSISCEKDGVSVNLNLNESLNKQYSGIMNALCTLVFIPGMSIELEKSADGKEIAVYADTFVIDKEVKTVGRFGVKASNSNVIKHMSVSQLLRPIMQGHEEATPDVRKLWEKDNAFLKEDGTIKTIEEILETFKKGVVVDKVFRYKSKEDVKEMRGRVLPHFVVKK